MGIRIRLKNVRISFANGLDEKSAVAGGTPKYGSDFLMVPGFSIEERTPAGWKPVAKFQDIIDKEALATWKTPEAAKNVLASLEPSKLCYRDGSKRFKADGVTPYEGYPGVWYVTAKSEKKPEKWARNAQPLASDDTSTIYSGCIVIAHMDIYGVPRAQARGVFAGLVGVQFVADADAFGGGGRSKPGDFEALPEEQEDLADIMG